MAVGDAYVFPVFLTPVLTPLFFPKPPTTFLTCFCRGERRKYAGKKSRLNRGSNLQPPGHEADTLTTEPSGRGIDDSNQYQNGQNFLDLDAVLNSSDSEDDSDFEEFDDDWKTDNLLAVKVRICFGITRGRYKTLTILF